MQHQGGHRGQTRGGGRALGPLRPRVSRVSVSNRGPSQLRIHGEDVIYSYTSQCGQNCNAIMKFELL